MSKTVANTITRTDQLIGDTSTNSVSAANRLVAVSMATQELMHDFGLGLSDKTYSLSFLDTVSWYDITTDVPSFSDPVDLRRGEDDHSERFTRKAAREIAVEINSLEEPSFAIDRIDNKTMLGIAYQSKHGAKTLHACDSYDGNGTWTADTTNGDATNITTDVLEFKQGSGSVNFDADVSQSGNNKTEIYNSDMSEVDLTDDVNLSSLVMWVYIPDVTNFTSVTTYWGSSATVYWSATVTTDIQGNAWVDGWNEIKVDWSDASETGTVDETAIGYLQIDFNYAGGQTNETDYRIDHIRMIRPEILTLHYSSWVIGTNNSGTDLTEFGATTDVQFYSGNYDFVDNYVAIKTAGYLFQQMGQAEEAQRMELLAQQEKTRIQRMLPAKRLSQTRSFKVRGLNFKKK